MVNTFVDSSLNCEITRTAILRPGRFSIGWLLKP